MPSRVCIIGLDCADPRLVFEQFAGDLPTLSALGGGGGREDGRDDAPAARGPLRSCHPPITIPAWPVMTSGRDPGELGLYGFRNRRDRSYAPLAIATGGEVRAPRIWDRLDRPGDYSIVVGVPGTWPPPPLRGELVSGFLAPGTSSRFTHPPELAREVERVTGGYLIDVPEFRTADKDRLLADIHTMTRRRFTLFRHLLRTRPWTFAMLVEMGTDRIHHGFWRHHDPGHRRHEPGTPWPNAIGDYYRLIDTEIAATLNALEDSVPAAERGDVTVMIVSDHGVRALEGGFAFNEWLIREGYLVLRSDLTAGAREAIAPAAAAGRVPLHPDLVDWTRTRAWGEGGYYGRLFLNLAGREPSGTVPPGEAEDLLAELSAELTALPDDRGRPMGTRCHRPRELYRRLTGIPPDLMIYFGDLAWRSIGSIDTAVAEGRTPPADIAEAALYTPGNDTGPDDANHDWEGIVIVSGGRADRDENVEHRGAPHTAAGPPRQIAQVAGFVLDRLGVEPGRS